MKKFILFVVVVVASLALTACGVKFNTQPQTSSQTPDVLVVTATPVPMQTQSPTVSAPTSTPVPTNATVPPTPTPETVVTKPTVRGWSRVGFENLPQPAGYPGWLFTIGDDRVPNKLGPFDLTLYEGQVALFQGVQFDASLVGGPLINQCYVVLVIGPVNWVKGELKIGISVADWHQTKEGFDPLLWISQRATDVSAAYKAKDLNCTLEKIQIWVYQP